MVRKEAPVIEIRNIKSSNGQLQARHVIETKLKMGAQQWNILITLTDRSAMSYLMLLGRQTMAGNVLIDPEMEYILGESKLS